MSDFGENKILKYMFKTIKIVFTLLLACIALVIVIQRVSNNTIAIGGIRIFNVISGSMVPKYEKGDILIVKKTDPSKIKVGQSVAYEGRSGQVAGKIITHEVIDIEQKDNKFLFHTKGITNEVQDPIVEEDQIYGTVIYKFVLLSFLNKIMYNIYVFYLLTVVPIGIIIFLEIKEIRERII